MASHIFGSQRLEFPTFHASMAEGCQEGEPLRGYWEESGQLALPFGSNTVQIIGQEAIVAVRPEEASDCNLAPSVHSAAA